ncbi:MAG: hypothetical protein ACTS9Y_07745 [Methylophilus sp.]|uniref:hypothetical protein n=1 Tax=Methylophilus sp. TaxID=29541 RepID=UPI003FA0D774
MPYSTVINEVASAINGVINVIAWSVLKVLPVLIAILIGLIAIDMLIGSMFGNQTQTESPFLSETSQTEIQLTSNEQVSPNELAAK